ncbi:type II toxin-antitoxin system VapC family toxin [Candidatus Woesearchaeota archaeon]|nr:type II toxin-antitoxin system VapC family toxin [Candidatus Woesearchaeota archaeon]
MKVVDTTFLIDFLDGSEETKKIVEKENVVTTQINVFEIVRGFFLDDNPSKASERAFDVLEGIRMLELDEGGIVRSAEISANLIKKGVKIPDADCLTAGISLSKGISTITTRNVKHFNRIPNIKIETY